jgi:hypothetical protein
VRGGLERGRGFWLVTRIPESFFWEDCAIAIRDLGRASPKGVHDSLTAKQATTLDQIRSRLDSFHVLNERLSREYSEKGALARSDWWRREYYAFPYLTGAKFEAIIERFCDIFFNTVDMNAEGQLTPHLDFKNEDSFMAKFTHMLEEINARGGMPTDVIERARTPIVDYFSKGDPIGIRLFAKFERDDAPILVKYSKRQFMQEMYEFGKIRICPASFYSASSHNGAIRDLETQRPFAIPTFRERLAGESHFEFQGHKIPLDAGNFEIPVEVQDYFLYSLSNHVYYRLPSDFDADAAIIVRDKNAFIQRLVSSFLAANPHYDVHYGDATYYDPCLDFTKIRIPEMSKHFRYSYQREFRIVFNKREPLRTKLVPQFLQIGSMRDYAELITL